MIDDKVFELAKEFIEDSAVELNGANTRALAQHIQDAIEIWFDQNEPL